MTLQRSFQNQQNRTVNSMAGRGQLYSGAMGRAQDADVTNYGQARQDLQGEYTSALDALRAGELEIGNTYEQGILDAEADRLAAAAEQRPEFAETKPGFLKRFNKRKRRRQRRNNND